MNVSLEKKVALSPTINNFDYFLKTNEYNLWLCVNHHKTFTNKKMTFKNHLFLKEILMDKSSHRVIMKSTQGGISECLIIMSWSAASNGATVFYVLPTHNLMARFVSNRFEKSLMNSAFYRKVKSTGKAETFRKDIIDNRSLKDIGRGVISFAGSYTDIPFVEIPADWLIVDEADQCDPKRLEMAKERLGHSENPHEIYVGNPTYQGSFLDEKYKESSQGEWFIKAKCGHKIQIDFFKHVLRQESENNYVILDKEFEFGNGGDVKPICDKCSKPFDRFGDGEYVNKFSSTLSGKSISRLFSGIGPLSDIVLDFSKALENDYKMQRFYNSQLGQPFTMEGSKVSRRLIEDSMGDYLMPSFSKEPCIMGVDVGKIIHVKINKILHDKRKQSVYIGTVLELEELFSLCRNYNVVVAVIDALPEIRLARKFSHYSIGYFRCFFGADKTDSVNLKEKVLTVSRLMAIDDFKEKLTLQQILFPKNILTMDEYMSHIQEPTRVWDEDRKVFSWLSNRPDHFFFAEVYASLAEKILKFM